MRTIFSFIGGLALLFGAVFGLQAFGLFNLNFWGVKYQDAHTNIFQETKAYRHGTIRDIENLCLEMSRVESETHRQALQQTIRHRVAAFDYSKIPARLKGCIE